MRIWLAPLQAYTDYIFRNIYAKHFSGINVAIAPFISLVPGETIAENRIREVLPENNLNTIPVIPQILGNDPHQYITLINRLQPLGYTHFNWNCGCPVHIVAKKKRGSGILPYPEIIDNTLKQVLSSTDAKLSVKLRLGYHSRDEMFEVINVLNQHKLEYVILHPRLGVQQYEGTVDLEGFEMFAKRIKHPIVYNGDISSIEDYQCLIARFPEVKEIMIGRGILRNLRLPEEIKSTFNLQSATSSEVKQMHTYNNHRLSAFYSDFINAQIDNHRPRCLIGVIKQYWIYFRHNFNVDDDTMRLLLRTINLKDLLQHGEAIIKKHENI